MQRKIQKVSEYDQEMPQPNMTDQPMARPGRSKEHLGHEIQNMQKHQALSSTARWLQN